MTGTIESWSVTKFMSNISLFNRIKSTPLIIVRNSILCYSLSIEMFIRHSRTFWRVWKISDTDWRNEDNNPGRYWRETCALYSVCNDVYKSSNSTIGEKRIVVRDHNYYHYPGCTLYNTPPFEAAYKLGLWNCTTKSANVSSFIGLKPTAMGQQFPNILCSL